MATSQTAIVWTALPCGSSESGKLVLSAFAAPRLEASAPGTTLATFPPFLDWPDVVRNISFLVRFDRGEPLRESAGQIKRITAGESAWWGALFSRNTPVRSRASTFHALGTLTPRSYSVSVLKDAVRNVYRAGLESERVGGRLSRAKQLAHPTLRPFLSTTRPGSEGTARDPVAEEIKRFSEYYRNTQGDTPHANASPPDPPDFHEIMTHANSYPLLLRKLGLVVDFELDVDPSTVSTAPKVRVLTDWRAPHAGVVEIWPWTQSAIKPIDAPGGGTRRWVFVTEASSVAGAHPDARAGLLRIADETLYDQADFDVESATFQILSYGRALQSAEAASLPDTEDTALPALRGAGLTVLRKGRDELLKGRLRETANQQRALDDQLRAMAAGTATGEWDRTFYMQDVQRGLRVDVQEENGPWRSLCWRAGRYTAGGQAFGASDEGFVPMGTARKSADATDHYVHEALFRWEGWSLCVPRPGAPVPQDEQGAGEGRPGPVSLSARFDPVGGSLPTLRIGRHRYRFRVRTVDLAGNSLSSRDADFVVTEPATAAEVVGPWVQLARAERLSAPLVYRAYERAEPKPDQDKPVTELVIRSEGGGTKTRAAMRDFYVVPPRVSMPTAELLSVFDVDRAGAYGELVKRDLWQRGARYDEAFSQGQLPFVPDPDTHAARLTGLPGATNPIDVAYPGVERWTRTGPFRLQLREPNPGEAAPVPEPNGLDVYLPKGKRALVTLSSVPAPRRSADLTETWLVEGLRAATAGGPRIRAALDQARSAADAAVKVRLIHAVQRPIFAPEFHGQPTSARKLGDTAATIAGELDFDRDGTARLDFAAEWSDWVDVPTEPGQRTIQRKEHAFSIEVDRIDESKLTLLPDGRTRFAFEGVHHLGDTRARAVRYTVSAASRFAAYFPEITDPEKFEMRGRPVTVTVRASARPAAPKVKYVIPAFVWTPADGWTRREPDIDTVTYERSRGGGALRVYLDRSWYSSGDEEQLAAILWRGPKGGGPPPDLLPDEARVLVTHWGGDPLWAPNATDKMPAGIARARFVDGTTTTDGAQLPEAKSFDHDVVCLPTVRYDPDRRLWYCDLQIDPRADYFPFVQLALVRYQKDAIPGCNLSVVAMAEIAQLVPARRASVVLSSADGAPVLTATVEAVTHQTTARPNEMYVSVLVEDERMVGELSWKPSAIAPVAMAPADPANLPQLWKSPAVPLTPVRHQRVRVVLHEYERFEADDQPDASTTRIVSRLSYADVLEIDDPDWPT